ncbi:ABC transporter ATP-binding protein [Agromyces subbeticus]|uniref:ABC transporter ATP-binding protein n=1 Tax=Agromyces subbeticus TaxID=293890 RepID=UPI0003B3E4CD|nr:ABC transporter ATP-binding protein [Agromyces subbeticus]
MIADSSPGALSAEFTTVVGEFTLEVAVRVESGELLAVLGPNGSGKSTLLSTIAGLRAPNSGFVTIGEQQLTHRDPAVSGRGIQVPLERRRVAMLGQQPLLFPHLSVVENVAFGPRSQGVTAHAARTAAMGWLERVELADLAGRRPTELSGGQQQRVAIARALAADPVLLLLDEPFAALDVQNAQSMRRLIADRPWGTRIPMVLVTHDPLDAIVLADRAAILHDGRIVQHGTPGEVFGHPATRFVAALAGVNLVTGLGTIDGSVMAEGPRGDRLLLRGNGGGLLAGNAASAVFGPGSVRVAPAGGERIAAVDTLDPNRWVGTIAQLEPTPGGVRIVTNEHPDVAVDVPSATAVTLDLAAGSHLAFEVPASDVSVRSIPAVLP